jgi:hypothetical protein
MYELTFEKNGRKFSELFRFKKAAYEAKKTVERNGYTNTDIRQVVAA